MSSKFYWTTLARAVFASLGRRGKVSLRDLLANGGRQGKAAQSSLVQALARWARKGFVSIDQSARHGAPRYALTPAGLALWNEAVSAAQTRLNAFYALPSRLGPVGNVQSPPRRVRKDAPGQVICPTCSERYELQALRQMKAQYRHATCTCNQILDAELAEAELRQEE